MRNMVMLRLVIEYNKLQQPTVVSFNCTVVIYHDIINILIFFAYLTMKQ